MPLIKGKSHHAFVHNVKAEREAGKPENQSLAIAYNVKKRAKKMYGGGRVDDLKNYTDFVEDHPQYAESIPPGTIRRAVNKEDFESAAKYDIERMSDGGMVGRVMERRYSDGGMIANDVGVAEVDEKPAEYDDLVLDDHLEDNSSAGNESDEERRRKMARQVMGR